MKDITAVQPTSSTVALFATCMVDQFLPEAGIATTRLLERFGVQVEFPQSQTCCGQPFFNSGHRPEAIARVKATIASLESYEAVVLPSGSCSAMIKVEYSHLLEEDPGWKLRAENLSQRTFELSEFLAVWNASTAPRSPGTRTQLSATYHDSCHMCRLLGLRSQPRQALAATGVELLEMAEPDRCCGFGGSFSIRMPEIARAMGVEKLHQAERSGAQVLVTADPGCLLHLRQCADSQDGRPPLLGIEHLASVLEERTR